MFIFSSSIYDLIDIVLGPLWLLRNLRKWIKEKKKRKRKKNKNIVLVLVLYSQRQICYLSSVFDMVNAYSTSVFLYDIV